MIDVIDPDGLSADWLTEALGSQGTLGAASVVDCTIEPLPAVSFTGEFRRLELGYDVDDPALPRSLVAKFAASDPDHRALIHSLGHYSREIGFYRELAARTPLPVPACFYAAIDDADGRCVILLEDLTAKRRGRSTDCLSAADTRHAVDAIARMHARWWRGADTDSLPWLDPEHLVITPRDTEETFAAQWPNFVAKLSVPITDRIRRFGDLAAREIFAVMEPLFYEQPLTVIHNDFQADNLLLGSGSGPEPLTVIDWQMVGQGRGPIDLAYLFSGSLDPEDRRRHEYELLDRYTHLLRAAGVPDDDADQCQADYRAALLLPPVRLACAVALTPFMTPHPGAFWDVLFDRQLRALADNGGLPS